MKIRGHLNEQNLCREDVAPTSDSRPVQFLRPPGCVAVNYVSCLQIWIDIDCKLKRFFHAMIFSQ